MMAAVVRATVRMLHWRGVATEALDIDDTQAQSSTAPMVVIRCVPLLVVVTEATSQQVRALLEAAGGDRRLQLVSRQPVNVHGHFMQDVTVVPWSLVLTYPLDHELVPRHRKAADDDLRRIGGLRLPRGTASLPALRADDPIAQYLALAVGDVVRIDRHDGTVYYRVVVVAR